MRLLTLLFTLLFSFNALAVAPYGIKGQSQSGTLYSNVHQFPNNLVTNLGGINALVETGNNNLLVNPSYEHATGNTGWTLSAGSFISDNSPIHGTRNAELSLTAQSLDFYQDSTLYASQFADGVQGLAMIRVRTSVTSTPIYVCPRTAGAYPTQLSSGCVTIQPTGKWGLYKVPFILGATSNGIGITSNAVSITGSVEVDDAFVGAVDLRADVNNVGAWTDGSCASTWVSNTTTTCKYRQLGDELEVQWRASTSGAPTATALQFDLPTGYTVDTSKMVVGTDFISEVGECLANDSGAAYYNCQSMLVSATRVSIRSVATSATYATTTSSLNATTPFTFGAGDYVVSTVRLPVTQFSGATSVYSSTNADTDWASCGHVPADFTAFGTVINIETQCKREGGDLLMRGKFTSGATTAVEARVNLKLSGLTLTSAPSSIIPSIQPAGDAVRNANSTTYFRNTVLIEPATSYITFGSQTSLANGLTKMTGSGSGIGSGEILAINARIPIAGWQNSNIIIGSFNGLESCTDTLECTDTFSAYITAAGIVSKENVDWISGNCSASGTQNTCTLNSNIGVTQDLNCSIGQYGGGEKTVATSSSTTLTISYTNSAGSGGAKTDIAVICQKQGADYIGKTAKAVASDQNIATPGTIKSTLCSAKISSTGVISDQKGGCFSSCTNATTPVCTFTSNFWVGGQIPNCWASGGGIVGVTTTSSTDTSTTITNGSSGVPLSSNRNYFCHGERQ